MLALARLLAFLALWCGAAGDAAAREYHALLVGVSEYPNLKQELWLHGPRNDVTRMREVLVARGVPAQNITVLADGVPGAELPTRANILGEMERLARNAKRDDYIVVMMAGHGSQEPVPAGSHYAADEPDGLFEIFLPRDVQAWVDPSPGAEGQVKNAIVDHEVRALVDRMTARGAFVWAIFDSCHSATMVRSAGSSEVKLRQVSPAELGLDKQVARAKERATGASQGAGPAASAAPPKARPRDEAGSVFFYAAQTLEPTAEMPLPLGAPDRRPHGLFTFTILQALESGGGMTYQQLAQQVLTRYGGMSEARATPLFSGTALDTGVLGQPASVVRQWPVADGAQITIAAGALAEIYEGAVFALLPTATAPNEQAVGYVLVSKADVARSVLEPVAFGDVPARAPGELKAGRIARLVKPAMKFDFVVASDLKRCTEPCAFRDAIAAVQAQKPGATAGPQVRWASANETANIKLVADGRRLWFMPPSMAAAEECGTGTAAAQRACHERREKSLVYLEAGPKATPAGIAGSLGDALHAVSRAMNLMRVAGTLSSSAAMAQLKLTLQHVGANGTETPITGDNVPQLKAGDKVRILVENTGRAPVDLTMLYLDSKYGIGVMFPDPGASNRLEPGAKLAAVDIDINDSTLGTERLAIIAAEARRQQARVDYSYLAQASLSSDTVTRGLESTRSGREGAVDADAGTLLRDAGFTPERTRAGTAATPPASMGMQVFSWKVVEP